MSKFLSYEESKRVGCGEPRRTFEAIQAPDDSWTVLDSATEAPAEWGGRPLIGLPHDSAMLFAHRLNTAVLELERS